MRFIFLLILLTAATLLAAGENLIPNPDFRDNFSGWWKSGRGISLQSDADGAPFLSCQHDSAKPQQRLIALLPGITQEDFKDGLFTLRFQARLTSLQGAVTVKIRQIDSNGSSLGYHTLRFCQYDTVADWQDFSGTYQMHPNTNKIGLYLDFFYLGEDDQFCLRSLSLTRQENKAPGQP